MTVYVVQDQQKKDAHSGKVRRRFETIDQLEAWGDVRFVLPPFTSSFDPETFYELIAEGLEHYDPEDWLVLVGTNTLCAATFARAAHLSDGVVKLLQWSSRQLEYVETRVRIF